MKVGFIGLGVMGAPMALNILKKGHQLTVFDLNPQAVATLVKAGAGGWVDAGAGAGGAWHAASNGIDRVSARSGRFIVATS